MSTKLLALLLTVLLLLSGCDAPESPVPAPEPSPSSAPVTVTDSPTQNHASEGTAIPGSIHTDITYCTMDGVPLKLDLYYPDSLETPAPLVVYIHGGGWTQGSRQGYLEMYYASALRNSGYILASVDYRLAPQYKFPAMIQDVKCAIRHLRAHAQAYGIDPERIGVIGVSAGGHLAALVGASDEGAGFDVGEYPGQSSRVGAVVDLFGPADLTIGYSPAYELMAESVFGTTDPADPVFAAASPVTYVTPDDPPFLILHGDRDQIVPLSQSQRLYERLIAAGVDAGLVVVQGGRHSLLDEQQSPSPQDLMLITLQFLEENLK